MLVETDYCIPSGKGTSMYSRKGAQTIAFHLCFRNSEHLEKYNQAVLDKNNAEKNWFNQKAKFKTLNEIKEYLDESVIQQDKLFHIQIAKRKRKNTHQSSSRTAADSEGLTSQQTTSQKDFRDSYYASRTKSTNVSFYRYNPQYSQIERYVKTAIMRQDSVREQMKKERQERQLKLQRDQSRGVINEDTNHLNVATEGNLNFIGNNKILETLAKKFKMQLQQENMNNQLKKQISLKKQNRLKSAKEVRRNTIQPFSGHNGNENESEYSFGSLQKRKHEQSKTLLHMRRQTVMQHPKNDHQLFDKSDFNQQLYGKSDIKPNKQQLNNDVLKPQQQFEPFNPYDVIHAPNAHYHDQHYQRLSLPRNQKASTNSISTLLGQPSQEKSKSAVYSKSFKVNSRNRPNLIQHTSEKFLINQTFTNFQQQSSQLIDPLIKERQVRENTANQHQKNGQQQSLSHRRTRSITIEKEVVDNDEDQNDFERASSIYGSTTYIYQNNEPTKKAFSVYNNNKSTADIIRGSNRMKGYQQTLQQEYGSQKTHHRIMSTAYQSSAQSSQRSMVDMDRQVGRSLVSVQSSKINSKKTESLNKMRENQFTIIDKNVTKFSPELMKTKDKAKLLNAEKLLAQLLGESQQI